MIEALEAKDVDLYTEAVAKFDKITKLDTWSIHMLLQPKNNIGPTELNDENDLC